MSPQHLHHVVTATAAALGGAAFLALSDGRIRSGLQLVALVLACFAVMIVNRRRALASQTPGSGGIPPTRPTPDSTLRRDSRGT